NGVNLSQSVGIVVEDAPLTGFPTTIGTMANPIQESTPFGPVAVASFTDANPMAQAGDFRANIKWGNGRDSTGTVQYHRSTQRFDVMVSGMYDDEGTISSYPISVDITDVDGGGNVTVHSTAQVTDAPLTGVGVEYDGCAYQPLTIDVPFNE